MILCKFLQKKMPTLSDELYILAFSLIGLPFATFSAVIFFLLIRQSNSTLDLFKYYFTKSIVDSLMLSFNVIISGLKMWCDPCHKTPIFIYIDLIIRLYVSFILFILSIYLELVATFNIYRKLVQYFKLLNRIPVYFKIIVPAIIFSTFYIYKFFERQVTEEVVFNGSVNETIYQLTFTDFRWTSLGKTFRMVNSLTRDAVFVALIIIVDILIAFKMREIISKRIKCRKAFLFKQI